MNINIGYNALPNSGRTAGFGRRSSSIYRNGNNTELNNKLTDAKQINSTKHVVVDISAEGKGLLADFLYGEDNLTVGNHYNAYLKELAQSENGITGALEEIDESWFLKGSEGHLFSNPRSFIEFERESYFGLVHGLSFIMSWNTFDNTSISQSFSNLASKFTEIRDLFQRNFTGAELDELLGELYLAKDQAVRNQANSHARSFLRDMEQKMFAMLYSNPSPDLTDRWSQLMDKLEEMRDQLKEILTGFGQLIVPFAIANGGFDPATDSWRIGLTPSDLNIANEFRDNFLARL